MVSSNTIGPFTNEYDTPSEKVIITCGYLDDTKQALVTTTATVVKEGNTDMVDKKRNLKKMLWRKPSLLQFQKKRN